MLRHTRREFLATTSVAMVGSVLASRRLAGLQLPIDVARSPLPAAAWLPEPHAGSDLRGLAMRAVDAARSAGASYADVRLAERHQLTLRMHPALVETPMHLESEYSYGIRVVVDGAWGFVHGSVASPDAMGTSARDAVAMARGYARRIKKRVELAPAPVATGEWDTPHEEDPFTVPLRDQSAQMGAYAQAARRVRYGQMEAMIEFLWTRETRVFASSEGALTKQILRRSEPRVRVEGDRLMGRVILRVPQSRIGMGGYETVTDPALQDRIKELTAQVVHLAALPRRVLDVGRYPVVLDGATLGMAFGRTMGCALELDRVLGYEADASGTSFVSPPAEMLGTSIGHPLLTVSGNRQSPTIGAVRWDDDGVEPQEYPMITNGRLVDYHTSRQTAPALRAWYEQQGQPLRSHGCAVAPKADDPVLVRAPHLTLAPSAQAATLEDLCKGVTRGIVIYDRTYLSTDQQLASGSLSIEPFNSPDGLMLEIEKGRIVRRIVGNGIQFATRSFWKSQLVVLGDERTVQDGTFEIDKGMPWRPVRQGTTAPAGLFKDVNVVLTQRRL